MGFMPDQELLDLLANIPSPRRIMETTEYASTIMTMEELIRLVRAEDINPDVRSILAVALRRRLNPGFPPMP